MTTCQQDLLDEGADIEAVDEDGNTALHYTVMGERAEMAKVRLACTELR